MKHISLVMFVVLSVLWPLPDEPRLYGDDSLAWAAEQRCTALGANCVCSEPFNTNVVTWVNTFWSNPSDSTTKECSFNTSAPGGATEWEFPSNYVARNDATMLSRLPAGHQVSWAQSHWSPGALIMLTGHNFTSQTQFLPRMSMRAYVYTSPDYTFRDDDPTACHYKFIQGNPAWHWENPWGPIHQYEFNTTQLTSTPNVFPMASCCDGVPGATDYMSKADWRGHWYYIEAVVTNRLGLPAPNGVRHILYMRDISNGIAKKASGAEFIAADWRGTTPGAPGGYDPWLGWDNLTASPAQKPVYFNFYREYHGGCNGWRAISHMMVAGWESDAGQRIGAATEVEGGAGPSPPAAPTNLRIISIIFMLASAFGMVGLVMGGTRWLARSREHAARTGPPDTVDGGDSRP